MFPVLSILVLVLILFSYWRFCGEEKYLATARRLAFWYDWSIFKETSVQRNNSRAHLK